MNRIPDPKHYQNMQKWAADMYTALTGMSGAQNTVLPQPVLLATITTDNADGVPPRAEQDGMLMYDPVGQTPVVSINGAWVALTVV